MKRFLTTIIILGLAWLCCISLRAMQETPRAPYIHEVCDELKLCSGFYDEDLFQSLPKEEWLQLCSDAMAKRQAEYHKADAMLDSVVCMAQTLRKSSFNGFADSLTFKQCTDSVYGPDSNAVVFISMLCNELIKSDEVTTPFYADYFLSLIIPDMERYMPQSELLALNYANLILANQELSESHVASAEKTIIETYEKLRRFEDRFGSYSSDAVREKVLLAYACAFAPTLSSRDVIDKEKLIENWKNVHSFYQQVAPYCQAEGLARLYARMMSKTRVFPQAFLLQYVLPNDPTYHDAFTDTAATDAIKLCDVVLASDKSSFSDKFLLYYVDKLFKAYMGSLTYQEACHAVDAYYNGIDMNEILSNRLLPNYANTLTAQVFLCDMSTLSTKEKHKRMNLYCHRLTQLFQSSLKTKVSRIQRGKLAYQFLSYWRIYKHLTPQEQADFFNSVKVFTNVQYFVHTEVVRRICAILLDGVFKYHPDLLIGTQHIGSVDEVKKASTRKALQKFLSDGIDNFDIGKASMPVVTATFFHLFVPRQKELAQMHPMMGSQVLKAVPHLQDYEDFVLNHHKWYNGKRGYPSWVDNTLSDVRLLVDILTVADCLEASVTNPYRLAYTPSSTFEEYLELMHRMSFTRFNPNVVSMILNHPDVKTQIKQLLEEGRGEIYYQVYQRYLMSGKE